MWVEQAAVELEKAKQELESATKGLCVGTQVARMRYENAMFGLDRAERAMLRAQREQRWHTPGSLEAIR